MAKPYSSSVVVVLTGAVLLLLLSACSSSDLLRQGIRDEVYRPGETEARVFSAQEYFTAMCRRSGHPSCQGRDVWNMIVKASLNDIEERCGGYLASLDDAKRDKAHIQRALADLATATTAIVGLTNPGVKALTVVRAAFDFGRGTVDEYYSPVILAEEPGIIERLVRKLQTQYRLLLDDRMRGKYLDGATTHYVVRGYLRLCLPVTIEAELKAIKLNANYVGTSRNFVIDKQTPVLQVLDAMPALQASGGGGAFPTPPPAPLPELPDADVRRGLCVEGSMSYAKAISEYRKAVGSSATGELATNEKRAISARTEPCDGQPYLTVFEKFAFETPSRIHELHRSLTLAMQAHAPAELVSFPDIDRFTPETREAIALLRVKLNIPAASPGVDSEFYFALIRSRG